MNKNIPANMLATMCLPDWQTVYCHSGQYRVRQSTLDMNIWQQGLRCYWRETNFIPIPVVLGDTKFQVSILPIPSSGMVVSSTEVLDTAMWPGSIFAFFQHLSHLNAWFSKAGKLISKRRTCLKPANVNMLLSLNKDVLMSRLASYCYWFQKGVEVYWYRYRSIPAQK